MNDTDLVTPQPASPDHKMQVLVPVPRLAWPGLAWLGPHVHTHAAHVRVIDEFQKGNRNWDGIFCIILS